MFDLKQMQKMQSQMRDKLDQVQGELESKEITGTAGGGALTVVCNGQQSILSVTIKPGVIDVDDEEREMLQDLMVAAANQALEASKQLSQKELGAVTGGIRIPGLTM